MTNMSDRKENQKTHKQLNILDSPAPKHHPHSWVFFYPRFTIQGTGLGQVS